MTTEMMKMLAKKRAKKDYEGKYPDMPEPKVEATAKIPNPVDRSYKQHSTADAVKGRNERAMGHGSVDVKIGEPELHTTGSDESHVEVYAPDKIELRKTDHKEGTYPDMPAPQDHSQDGAVADKKFNMLKNLLGQMRGMDGK